MQRRLRITLAALQDFRAARRWLTQPGSGQTGRKRWRILQQAPRLLVAYPYAGAADPGRPDLRLLVVTRYRIVYQLDPDTGDSETAGDVRVVAVLGPGEP